MSFQIVGYLKDRKDQVVIKVPEDIDIHWVVHKLNEAYTIKKNKLKVTYEETESEGEEEDLDDTFVKDEILEEDEESLSSEESSCDEESEEDFTRKRIVKKKVSVSFDTKNK